MILLLAVEKVLPMHYEKAILVRYGEVWLKTRHVRRRFEQILVGNLRALFPKKVRISIVPGRVFVHSPEAPEGLEKVFGLTSFSPVYIVEKDIAPIKKVAKELSKKWARKSSFAIRASRTDKSFPMTSKEIEIAVANELPPGFPVDLSEPDNKLTIEIRDRAYIHEKEIKGVGGLPLGSGGVAAAMLRDEKDLAAAWLMMKRGVALMLVKPDKKLLKAIGKWTIGRKVRTAKSLKEIQKKVKAVADIREEKPVKEKLIVLNPLAGWPEEEIRALLKTIR
jgi:thiamine biosynthesis protein ThiI